MATEGRLTLERVQHSTEHRLMELRFVWRINDWIGARRRGVDESDCSADRVLKRFLISSDGVTVGRDPDSGKDTEWSAFLGTDFGVGDKVVVGLFCSNSASRQCIKKATQGCAARVRISTEQVSLPTQYVCIDTNPADPYFLVALLSKRGREATQRDDFVWMAGMLCIEIVVTLTDCHASRWLEPPTNCATARRIGQRLFEMMEAGEHTDFVLVSSDLKELKVNRNILVAGSDVFQAMLQAGMQEAITGRCVITDVDYETLKIIVDFFHGVNVDERIAQCPVNVFVAADKYELEELMEKSETAMQDSMTVENVVERYILARRYTLLETVEWVGHFIQNHHDEFVATNGTADIVTKAPEYQQDFFRMVFQKMSGNKRTAAEAGL